MGDPKAVRLRDHEESYVSQQDKPFSEIVREPLTQNVIEEAIGVCTATGKLQYHPEADRLTDPNVETLTHRISGKNSIEYKDSNHSLVSWQNNETVDSSKRKIDYNATQVKLYPFTNAHDTHDDMFNFEWNEKYPVATKTHTLWAVETMAIETAGGKPWDYIISLLSALSDDESTTKEEFLSIAYMRGIAMLDLLEYMVDQNGEKEAISDLLEMCLEDILTWMVNIEQMYSPPAHTPANQSQVQNNPTPANVVAGAIDIEQYAEKALSYDSSIQPSQVVRTLTPTSKNRFADTNSSDVHTLEWVTEQYNGSNQETKEDIIEFYPATAAVCFSRYTSKSLTEWFIHATSGVNNTTEQDSSSKLKVGDPNDQQSKFAIIPADATPTWIKAKDGYVLLNTSTSDVDDVTIYAVLETPTAEYTLAATVSSWCRYDEHQEEWVVYDNSGSEYRYTTKQDLESAWSFIQLPKSQDTTPNYTINANNIGEIGLPHQPTGILLGRDIYKKAREEWNEVKKTKNTSTEHSSDPEQTADVNELKDILNQIAEDESDVYLVDPKNDDVEDLYDRLPPHILENATWIRSEEIDEKTLKSINLLEPTIGKDHPRYNDAVESIVANIKSQLQINEYWGPVMDDIIGTILRAMIRSEKIYAGSDLYEVLTNTGRRNQFAQSIEEEGVELTSDEEYLIDKQIEKYTKRISEMDQEDIDPVVRRLKDYIEH